MDTGTATAAATRSMTGMTRDNSSSALSPGPAQVSGRVDSPPMSIRSAPSRSICLAWATAVSRSVTPSPENESGVTLTMPITYVRAPHVKSRAPMRADRIVAAIGLSVASCRFGDWHQTEPPPRGRRGARSTANGPRDHRPLLRLPAPQTRRLLRRHPGYAHRRSPLRRNGAARWCGGGGGAAPGRRRLAAGGGAGHAPGARPDVEHVLRSPQRGHGGHRGDWNRWQDDHHDDDPPDAAERRAARRLDEHGGYPPGRRHRSKRFAPDDPGGARGPGAIGPDARCRTEVRRDRNQLAWARLATRGGGRV